MRLCIYDRVVYNICEIKFRVIYSGWGRKDDKLLILERKFNREDI